MEANTGPRQQRCDEDVQARVARLRDRADTERPESWVAKDPGDELAGELLRYERGSTAFDDNAIIAVIQPPGQEPRALWLLNAVLRDEMAKLRPAPRRGETPGEFVLVRYLGKRQAGDGRDYQAYRVVVDREPMQPDWSAIAADAEAELEAQRSS